MVKVVKDGKNVKNAKNVSYKNINKLWIWSQQIKFCIIGLVNWVS